jgi:hypothetical protein
MREAAQEYLKELLKKYYRQKRDLGEGEVTVKTSVDVFIPTPGQRLHVENFSWETAHVRWENENEEPITDAEFIDWNSCRYNPDRYFNFGRDERKKVFDGVWTG